MKQFYLIALCILLAHFSFATSILANTNNGVWKNASTWDKNRKPQDGDTIVIPAGKTIFINDAQSLNNVYVRVYGNLKFQNLFSSLTLNATSRLTLYNNATIETTLDFLQYLIIGGTYVFYEGTTTGPLTATSSGFTGFNPLPVKFSGFTATLQNNNAMVQWSTAQEDNVNMYEVERSADGSNWNTIAYVAPFNADQNNYAFTDKNLNAKITYYRIKEVDFDGKVNYTAIQSVKKGATATSGISIASMQNKVVLQFPQAVSGNVTVRFVSFSGQVLDQKIISNPVGQVVLSSKLTGNYIISVSNGQEINTAKQVIL